jgi:hypothetical protein
VQHWQFCRKTGNPFFEIYFDDVDVVYNRLDLDYIMKYSNDVPLKYHKLKAEYIVRLASLKSPSPKDNYEMKEPPVRVKNSTGEIKLTDSSEVKEDNVVRVQKKRAKLNQDDDSQDMSIVETSIIFPEESDREE